MRREARGLRCVEGKGRMKVHIPFESLEAEVKLYHWDDGSCMSH
jgi:hypothetical protein